MYINFNKIREIYLFSLWCFMQDLILEWILVCITYIYWHHVELVDSTENLLLTVHGEVLISSEGMQINEGIFIALHLRDTGSFLAHLSQRLKWVFLITICLLSVGAVVVVVIVYVNFSHFHLLLQNHWANFNQIWHKVVLDEGGLSLFKWKAEPFSKGRQLRNSKNTLTKFI